VSMIDLAFATGTLLGHSRVDLGLNTTAQSIR
jgi:hypothetical protein